MNKALSPIKRSSHLAPLSLEHHEDLLLGWKIREGLKKGISNDRIRRYCVWFFDNHIKDHFRKEEEGFTGILDPDHPMLRTMFEDHEKIRSVVGKLTSDDECAGQDLLDLAKIITDHVRYEERQLFNYIEKTATKEELLELGGSCQLILCRYGKMNSG